MQKDDTHISEAFHVLHSSQKLFDTSLVNTKETQGVKTQHVESNVEIVIFPYKKRERGTEEGTEGEWKGGRENVTSSAHSLFTLYSFLVFWPGIQL